MNKRNYQRELDSLLEALPSSPLPRLLLHACCAPCSSYVLEYLSRYFDITLLFYNPNIFPSEEYEKRYAELKRLVQELPHPNPISFAVCSYDPDAFFQRYAGWNHFQKAAPAVLYVIVSGLLKRQRQQKMVVLIILPLRFLSAQ